MTKEPIITVYITNRNYYKFLNDAIKSVLNQTYKNIELIIIDDGSTDKSREIIKKYENKGICRAIYNSKPRGLIKSSNLAIKASKGSYVIRLDADDYLDENAISILFSSINQDKNIALVYSDYYLVDEKKLILSQEKQLYRSDREFNDTPVLAACCLIRKNAIFSVNLYDERFKRQDGYDIWYKLIKNFKIKHVSLPLFYYRRHNSNLTNNQLKLYKTRSKILKKFAQKKKKLKDLVIDCVIPVRGHNVDKYCNSLNILNKKYLICHTIDEALKVTNFKKIIISSADKKLIRILKKIYNHKILFHERKTEQAQQNLDFKGAVIEAIKKFNKSSIDLLSIMTIENPFRKYFYVEQAISNLIIHNSDLVIGSIPDFENNYYKYTNSGIKLLNNEKNQQLKLEKNIILRDVGAFGVFKFSSYLNNNIKKITNVVLDDKDAITINEINRIKNFKI